VEEEKALPAAADGAGPNDRPTTDLAPLPVWSPHPSAFVITGPAAADQ
jgi:hypothetical protein